MNIHLITYLTSKLFWIYTVFRYNTILYPKNEDTQKLFAYFCAYLLSCWGSMQWGTMYGDLIFELIALLIITVAYQADWQHHVWNTLMVYIMGILCDGIIMKFTRAQMFSIQYWIPALRKISYFSSQQTGKSMNTSCRFRGIRQK